MTGTTLLLQRAGLIKECGQCGSMIRPKWFREKEYDKYGGPTGRTRRAISHLECEGCGKKTCVDDSFDGPWEVVK